MNYNQQSWTNPRNKSRLDSYGFTVEIRGVSTVMNLTVGESRVSLVMI